MNVSLTPKLKKLVKAKVATGLYGSASEVVREALRQMEERDKARRIQLAELRKDVADGVQQIRRGEVREFDPTAVEEIRSRGERIRAAARRRGRS